MCLHAEQRSALEKNKGQRAPNARNSSEKKRPEKKKFTLAEDMAIKNALNEYATRPCPAPMHPSAYKPRPPDLTSGMYVLCRYGWNQWDKVLQSSPALEANLRSAMSVKERANREFHWCQPVQTHFREVSCFVHLKCGVLIQNPKEQSQGMLPSTSLERMTNSSVIVLIAGKRNPWTPKPGKTKIDGRPWTQKGSV